MPLPEDRGLRGDGRPKVRRFRNQQLDLGQRLVAFRERHGVTQVEVARAVGTANASTVSLWEGGVNVPGGMLRERLADLLDGRRWPELRAAMLADAGERLPEPWSRAARWYRRASRERRPREAVGAVVAAILGELRGVAAAGAMREHYGRRDGDWTVAAIGHRGLVAEAGVGLRRVEDAAYGLRWLELAHGQQLDLGRSLVPQLPLMLLDAASGAP